MSKLQWKKVKIEGTFFMKADDDIGIEESRIEVWLRDQPQYAIPEISLIPEEVKEDT